MSEEKTATVTKPERRTAMPAKAPKKISQGTVKGKIAAINVQMNENQAFVRAFYG